MIPRYGFVDAVYVIDVVIIWWYPMSFHTLGPIIESFMVMTSL